VELDPAQLLLAEVLIPLGSWVGSSVS